MTTLFFSFISSLFDWIMLISRVLNKSWQLAKFTCYFMWTRHLLSLGNSPPPKAKIKCLCSVQTQIFAPECWNCSLKGPNFQIFPGGMPPGHPSNLPFWHSQVAPVTMSFFFLRLLQSFCYLLENPTLEYGLKDLFTPALVKCRSWPWQ